MTPVFGHGRLRLYLLKLLDESPRHGYEIIQQLKERFAGLYAPSAGTVYPRLARLESEGLVRHETDGGRKIYHITDAGRAELAAKASELAALETEIRNSVRDLAEGIREEVRESARTVQEELASAAREAQQAARGDRPSSGGAPFPFGPGPWNWGPGNWGPGNSTPGSTTPDQDDSVPTDAPPGEGPSGTPFAAVPPPESVHWTKEQWREWKQQQREQWRDWRRDWQQAQHQQRGQWKDAQRAWKDQWARQWKEQWEEQQRQWSTMPPPWAWWTGSGAGPADTDSRGERTAASDTDGTTDTTASDGSPSDGTTDSGKSQSQDRRSRQRNDWEVFGPQLRDLAGYLRHEVGPMVEAARRHGPLVEDELAQARAIIDRALSELRSLFEQPSASEDRPEIQDSTPIQDQVDIQDHEDHDGPQDSQDS